MYNERYSEFKSGKYEQRNTNIFLKTQCQLKTEVYKKDMWYGMTVQETTIKNV